MKSLMSIWSCESSSSVTAICCKATAQVLPYDVAWLRGNNGAQLAGCVVNKGLPTLRTGWARLEMPFSTAQGTYRPSNTRCYVRQSNVVCKVMMKMNEQSHESVASSHGVISAEAEQPHHLLTITLRPTSNQNISTTLLDRTSEATAAQVVCRC